MKSLFQFASVLFLILSFTVVFADELKPDESEQNELKQNEPVAVQPEPAAQPPARQDVRQEETRSAEKIRFNFRYAPWKDVIEWFADQAGLSLQADNVPSGSLNLTDNQYYTPTEALDVLNSYLLFKEYTILRKGKSMFVIYLPDGIPPNLLEPITPAELDNRGKYEICRCVFNLNRTTPDIIQAEAEKLLGPQGSLVSLPKSQQIVVTETAGTLRTIREIIKRIDDPEELVSGTIHTIDTKNLSADEALGIMRKLLAIDDADASLRTAVDVSGTKIWMSGRGDMIERAKEIINTIDSSFASKDVLLEGQTQFDTHDPGTADPATVLAVLQTLLAGTPDVRLSLDAKTGGIMALGRPANHATIKETIKQMQLNVPQVDVIPLKRMSPLSAVESIKKFFATGSPADTTTSTTSTAAKTTAINVPAPTVEADTAARQIIVRGTITQIKDIRSLLAKLGEDGTGARTVNASTIRTVPLSPAASTLVLERLQEVWQKLEPNSKINVITPDKKQEPEPKKENLDKLIDETFDKIPLTDIRGRKPVRYVPVQQTVVKEFAPVYQPIIGEENVSRSSQKQITVSQGPGGLMISCDDPETLDRLEELIRMLSDETVLGKTELKPYYLKNSTAEVVSQMLQSLMGSGSSTTQGVSGAGSVDAPNFDAALLGLIPQGNSIEKTGTVLITADVRLNALMVQANPVDHKTIEKLLPILDQAGRDDIMNRAKPRLVALQNIRAEEAKTVVETVYASRMQGGTSGNNNAASNSSRGNRSNNAPAMPQEGMPGMPGGGFPGMPPGGPGGMMQQLMDRLGNQRSGSSTPKEQEPPMTISVDSRSNSLIVSSSESLFLEVEAFVKELDAAALQTETVVETVLLTKVSPDLARQTISNVLGNSVTFTTSKVSTQQTGSQNPFGSGFGGNRSPFGGNSSGFGGGFGSGQRNFGGFGNGFGGGMGGANPFLNMMRGGGFGGGGR
ncbi:hypothetical protein FACS1894189_1280 [Planctomycetales bacterium]|nr:hypothetical protein FACS1894189_1280 [Planctomycetales bacterium]